VRSPNIIVPRQTTDTSSPLAPSLRYCIIACEAARDWVRQRTAQNGLSQPVGRATSAIDDDFGGHLKVIVVVDVEAVIAAVADLVEPRDEIGEPFAVRAFSREDAEVRRRGVLLGARADLLPHEIGQLDEEDLLRVERVDVLARRARGKRVERVDREAEVRRRGAEHDVGGDRQRLRRAARRLRLVGNADAERHGEHRELAKIACGAIRARFGVRRRRRLHDDELRADLAREREHRFRHVDLVRVELAVEPFEIAQRLEAGDAQSAFPHGAHAGRRALGMSSDVGGGDHHLAETRQADRRELALERSRERRGIHAEVGEVHLRTATGCISLCTSSNITLPR
jgi:hypothetical protein